MQFVDNGRVDNGRATVFLYFVDNGRADNGQQTLFWADNGQQTFLYFLKFFKHCAVATVLVVVPNALYLLVVDEKLFNDTNKYVYNFPT